MDPNLSVGGACGGGVGEGGSSERVRPPLPRVPADAAQRTGMYAPNFVRLDRWLLHFHHVIIIHLSYLVPDIICLLSDTSLAQTAWKS